MVLQLVIVFFALDKLREEITTIWVSRTMELHFLPKKALGMRGLERKERIGDSVCKNVWKGNMSKPSVRRWPSQLNPCEALLDVGWSPCRTPSKSCSMNIPKDAESW